MFTNRILVLITGLSCQNGLYTAELLLSSNEVSGVNLGFEWEIVFDVSEPDGSSRDLFSFDRLHALGGNLKHRSAGALS
jgi:hypothetical protein